jgi:Ribbon-helix-helix protein, copG family
MLHMDAPLMRGYDGRVKRTTVMLPDEIDARLRFEARRRGVPVAELIREAIEAKYGQAAPPRRFRFSGVPIEAGYPGFPPNAAERYREHLAELYERDYPRDRERPDNADR